MTQLKTGNTLRHTKPTKKLLLVDLDGCVAPMGAVPEENAPLIIAGDWATWQVSLNVQLWLESLPLDVEVRWASAWESYIEPVNAALGTDFDHLEFESDSPSFEWFKLQTVRAIVESGKYSTIVWVDDDLEESSEALAGKHSELHLVRPDPTLGLTRSELAAIDVILRGQRH